MHLWSVCSLNVSLADEADEVSLVSNTLTLYFSSPTKKFYRIHLIKLKEFGGLEVVNRLSAGMGLAQQCENKMETIHGNETALREFRSFYKTKVMEILQENLLT